MTGDFSRRSFDPARHHDGVLMQQGRPQLDADWNEQVAIDAYRREIQARDVIGQHGAPRATPGFAIGGLAALEFDGVDDHVRFAEQGSLAKAELSSFTCAARIILPQQGGAGVLISAMRRSHPGAWLLEIDDERRPVFRYPGTDDDADLASLVSAEPIPPGASAHTVGVSCDGDRVRLLMDDAEVASAACPVEGRGHHAPVGVGSAPRHRSHVAGRHFRGRLEELRVWDEAPPWEQPVAYWSLANIAGGIVADISGNGNDGILGDGRGEGRPRVLLRNLSIGSGRLYVDGILCENEQPHSLDDQPDAPAEALPDGRAWLVYLDVWKRELSYRQDPLIREVALGGPDTTLRARIVWQVKVVALDDEHAWSESMHVVSHRRRRPGRLRARREGVPDATLNNQLYRVEIHATDVESGESTFKWSRENGSIDFAVRNVQRQPELVSLEDLGRDAYALHERDWVEFVDDVLALRGASGPLLQVGSLDRGGNTVVLNGLSQVELDFDATRNPLLRRWDQGADATELVDGAVRVQPETWQTLEDGVQVSFVDPGERYHPGDYWLIPARTQTGDVEWQGDHEHPEPRLPDGIEHHFAPLAVLTLAPDGVRVVDRRHVFSPLTDHQTTLEGARGQRLEGSPEIEGDLSVRGNAHLHGHVRVGHLTGRLGEGLVGSEQIADGAVTAAKLAPELELVPPGFAVLASTTHAPHGFVHTGWSLTLDASGWQRAIDSGFSGHLAAVAHDRHIFVFADSGGVWGFHVDDDRIFEVARLEPPRREFAVGVVHGRLLVVGGIDDGSSQSTSTTLELEVDAGTWRERAPMPTPRSHLAAATLGQRLHVVGGQRQAELAIHEAYDPVADEWSTRPPMPTPRTGLAAAACDGLLFAIGGARRSPFRQRRREPINRNEAYDPATDRWHERAPLRVARMRHVAIEYRDGLIVAGGERLPHSDRQGMVGFRGRETYQPTLDLWAHAAPLAHGLGATPLALAVAEGILYAVGFDNGQPEEIHIRRLLMTMYVHQRDH